jgi:hypothetical protein
MIVSIGMLVWSEVIHTGWAPGSELPDHGRMLRGFEIGHLCDEKKMDYIAAPDWQAGFAVAHVEGGTGFPHIQLILNETESLTFRIMAALH